ncbi:CRISPR-associated endonuclease Cas1 [bacterium]|nr:CRISPR-associated endonuclease Cas1 [bacterium]
MANPEPIEVAHEQEARENLLPARMLNEYAYCPRLFHLEYVDQQFRHNSDTLDGRLIHRRVDHEKGVAPGPTELSKQDTIHARSVLLSDHELGAIARIDLLEGEDEKVVPVDYKRGKPPDIPEGAYEPERVQVCLQGLLLQRNGYSCDQGVLYFAEAQKRVPVLFTEILVQRTLELLAQARNAAKSGILPPPLVQSPKCGRCSLVSICLPDETNLLRSDLAPGALRPPAVAGNSDVRRLIPARDDGMPLYVQGYARSVGISGELLEIREKGKVIDRVKLLDVTQLCLFGNNQISAQALRELAMREIPIIHLSSGGWLVAVTTQPPHKNIELRKAQFAKSADLSYTLALSKAFVSGKIRNCRTFLRRNAHDVPKETLNRLVQWRGRADRCETMDQLLGCEGMAAREYFSHLPQMLKSRNGGNILFDFHSRNRRPPRDPVNALLSFLYSMLMKDTLSSATAVGMDPYLGFYHQSHYGRPALALDLMEEFRPLVADSVAIAMINNGEIQPFDFVSRAGATGLTETGRRHVLAAYERRMDTLITHPLFGYSISYRRVLEVQARLVSRCITGELERYIPFCTR